MVSTPVQTSPTKSTPISKPLSPPVIQEDTTVSHTSVLTSEQTTSSSPVRASSPASTVSVSPPHHADQRPVASSPPIASTITVMPGLNPLLTPREGEPPATTASSEPENMNSQSAQQPIDQNPECLVMLTDN